MAHRSPSLTFKAIKDKYPVSTDDLSKLTETYYEVTVRLYQRVPFHNQWQLLDLEPGLKEMMKALVSRDEQGSEKI